ncbi:MAG TPA: hypothetical protein VNO21_04950, partial [Polyangiaceae bacterium]|nr:hypothetical protein [Polyangiaceae bacterium]
MLAVFTWCLFSPAAQVWAQAQSPQQMLIVRGRQLFEDQEYEESIQALSAALLHPSDTVNEVIEIHRLLALDYITLGKKEEAASAVRGLLALRPDYALPSSESPRFRDFFATTREMWLAEGRPGLVSASGPAPPPAVIVHDS